ncbi:Queuine tRNA-ribosyltransferase domain-containing protein [Phytophthora infestans]|uniref:Queuine tRNA-ribosyltransferase accessory subunit 2 n=1 Tax=Phytophthora infestans TaxID=4787 RepID=A0A8S9V3W7_PHYIN|nr:Queuine tRNA-ribosyltransferase domain-containing protein [Phytophthora infestans]
MHVAKVTFARVNFLFNRTKTPCYLPPSIVGNVPHLTPDNCSKVKDLTAQVVDFADILSLVKLATDEKIPFRELLNVTDYELVLSARDYISESNPPSSKGTGFMVETSGGRRTISIEEFMRATELLQPELVVPLADEIPVEKGRNRHRTAVQTSLAWLDACQALNTSRTPMCGVVVGGDDHTLRRMSAGETCKRDIQAILLSGLGTCPERATLIDVIVNEITPASLPRVITGIGHPLDVLDTVNRGIDGFVSPYPATVTKAGSALIFWISEDEDGGSASERNAERRRSGGVLHLREKRFATDFGPLMAGCNCFACQKYTRAYVHHLLNVREMLGDILLYLHNLQHYFRFFREIRTSISTDRFAAYHAEFSTKFDEKASTAPPLIIPATIEERERKVDAEKELTKENKVKDTASKHEAAILKRLRP